MLKLNVLLNKMLRISIIYYAKMDIILRNCVVNIVIITLYIITLYTYYIIFKKIK